MGSVYQRSSDGRWMAAISRGPRGGRTVTVRSARTKAEAEAKLLEMGGSTRPASPQERFWAKVKQGPGCWEWQGARLNKKPYGVFQVEPGRKVVASRFAYEERVGPIPADRYVLHRCDNPPCVRPDHLFLGTLADNTADMVAKGRASFQRRAIGNAVAVNETTFSPTDHGEERPN